MNYLRTFAVAVLMTLVSMPVQSAVVYKYRVYFKDKKESPYKRSNPEQFLSQKALQRRAKWHIKIDKRDLPVSPAYLGRLTSAGVKVACVSKWNNTALVVTEDSTVVEKLAKMPFVDSVKNVFHAVPPKLPNDSVRYAELRDSASTASDYYGLAAKQIQQLNGVMLHNLGFRGQGMTIAILDGGFRNADRVKLLDNVKVLGTHNFVNPEYTVFAENSHGTSVLSCMGTNKPMCFVGTAPEADYWLLVSEDTRTETPSEEDTWAAALEFADSVGADVVNSSLGYNLFDDSVWNVKYRELDGKTRMISRTASLAASKGLLVVNSAGNSGDESWKLIGIPADADNIISAGAVAFDGKNANFSSLGNTYDGRVKPDVMADGASTAVVRSDGRTGKASGTSFSSPITAGMVACLMQALPKLTPKEIIKLVKESGNNSAHPDNVFGYGIPDYYKAYMTGKHQK